MLYAVPDVRLIFTSWMVPMWGYPDLPARPSGWPNVMLLREDMTMRTTASHLHSRASMHVNAGICDAR